MLMSPTMIRVRDGLIRDWRGRVYVKDGNNIRPAILVSYEDHEDDWIGVRTGVAKIYWSDSGTIDFSTYDKIRLDLLDLPTRIHVANKVFNTLDCKPKVWRAYSAGRPRGVAFKFGWEGEVWYEGGDWWDPGQGHHQDRLCPDLAVLNPQIGMVMTDTHPLHIEAMAIVAKQIIKTGVLDEAPAIP